MADSKNSFVVYTDIKETLDGLTDDQVATLFRGMVDYQLTGSVPEFEGVLKFAFIPIRQQMDRDNTKWERTKAARTESGRQGGIRSGEVRRAKAQSEANEASASQSKQNEANEANGEITVYDIAQPADLLGQNPCVIGSQVTDNSVLIELSMKAVEEGNFGGETLFGTLENGVLSAGEVNTELVPEDVQAAYADYIQQMIDGTFMGGAAETEAE